MRCRESTRSCVRNRSLYLYIGLAQRLLWRYKFSQQKCLAPLFAAQIHQRIKNEAGNIAISPIPGSPKNIRRRGWDQMKTIARILERDYRIPMVELFNHRDQKAQKNLNKQERVINAENTFSLKPNVKLPQSIHTIILIDDVYTTGSTIDQCTKLARGLDIQHIQSITLCIAL